MSQFNFYTISAKAYKLITKYFSICAVKEVIIANRAPGMIDTDLDSSLSRILFWVISEVYKSDFSCCTISKPNGRIYEQNESISKPKKEQASATQQYLGKRLQPLD